MTDFQLYVVLANIWALHLAGERYAIFCCAFFTMLAAIELIKGLFV